MFASTLRLNIKTFRTAVCGGSIFLSATHAFAAPICKPDITVREVRFTPIQLETMERRWTATLSVEASRCATDVGRFDIAISQLKETAPDTDFIERFFWRPGVMDVNIDFAADEAVESYRIVYVAPCPCRE